MQELDERRSGLSGDREHREAVAEQDDVVRDQERQERTAEETVG